MDKEKSIQWTSENVANFFVFLREQPKQIENFSEETIFEVLNLGMLQSMSFSVYSLGDFTFSVSVLFPEQHLKLWKTFIEVFDLQSEFYYLTVKSLIQIFCGIFSQKDQKLISAVCESPQFLKFFDELLNKLRSASLFDISKTSIFELINTPTIEIQTRLSDLLAEKLHSEILTLKDPGDYHKYEQIIEILIALNYFDSKNYAKKDLFIELSNRIFLSNITVKESVLINHNDYIKSYYFKLFLSLSKDLNLFQIGLVDQVVLALHKELNSKFFKTNSDILSECICNLAFLNYPGRFTSKIPHKEIYWVAWQSLIDKTEDLFLTTLGSKSTEDLTVPHLRTVSQRNLNFLWTLCVFNINSPGLIQTLLLPENLSPTENYNEEDMKKLFQIYYWVNYENKGQYELDSLLLENMNNFKKQFDCNNSVRTQSSEFRDAVKLTLKEKNFEFKENFSDFPYQLDFVHRHKKVGIFIDDESKYLDGTDMQIKNGYYKIMSRQLVSLGWAVQKISLRNWLSINTSDLLPRD